MFSLSEAFRYATSTSVCSSSQSFLTAIAAITLMAVSLAGRGEGVVVVNPLSLGKSLRYQPGLTGVNGAVFVKLVS